MIKHWSKILVNILSYWLMKSLLINIMVCIIIKLTLFKTDIYSSRLVAIFFCENILMIILYHLLTFWLFYYQCNKLYLWMFSVCFIV